MTLDLRFLAIGVGIALEVRLLAFGLSLVPLGALARLGAGVGGIDQAQRRLAAGDQDVLQSGEIRPKVL